MCKNSKKRAPIQPYRLKLTLLALPFVVFVFLFSYVPLLGWGLAFFDYKPGLSLDKIKFVGFKYFQLMFFYKEDILNALLNTLVLSFLSMAVSVLPIVFAILLTELRHSRMRKVIQTVVTLPHFVSWIIVYALCFALFSSNGMVSQVLMKLGLTNKPLMLMTNASTAWLFMTLLGIWKELGWNSIIYLAAITGIDEEYYDAARVDGAGRFRCIWHITVPGLMPTFIVLLLLKVGNLLSVGFDQYLVFNNAMISSRLEVLDLYTYRIGIGTQDYSFAVAVGIVKSVVSLLMLFSVNALAKRVRGESII